MHSPFGRSEQRSAIRDLVAATRFVVDSDLVLGFRRHQVVAGGTRGRSDMVALYAFSVAVARYHATPTGLVTLLATPGCPCTAMAVEALPAWSAPGSGRKLPADLSGIGLVIGR